MKLTTLDTDPSTGMNREHLRANLQIALSNLVTNLGGNRVRVAEMIQVIIATIPEFLEGLRADLTTQHWNSAAARLHKIKVQFGYLNRQDFLKELSAWETHLAGEATKLTEVEMKRFKEVESHTLAILEALKKTEFPSTLETVAMEEKQPNNHLVLIAEDDEVNAMVFETFIAEYGYQSIVVKDGHEAVRQAFERSPDLIFMDVHMPFFSGLEAIRELRSKGFSKPIISLSASTRLNEQKESLEAGANQFLTKPTKIENIIATLTKYLPVV